MIQYIVILLDDTSVPFCHYPNKKQERRLMPLDTLKAGILYAMKENLNVQFVYPDCPLPVEYEEAIECIDRVKIKPYAVSDGADVVVVNGVAEAESLISNGGKFCASYVLRIDKKSLFAQSSLVVAILYKVARLNIVITDLECFSNADFDAYKLWLQEINKSVASLYVDGKSPQLNLLTDRMMLDGMNNCGAGDTCVTLAPDGNFYVCPAFYLSEDGYAVGSLHNGLDVRNPQLYRLDHAPICRHCDAYQCKRCIWLNRKLTLEVNTPSHEQCVVAHLERNESRNLMLTLRRYGEFLPNKKEIKEISYLDPYDMRNEWNNQ